MSATPPEANTEYSRGLRASRRAGFAARRRHSSVGAAIACVGVLGALLLIVAEFTTLYSVKAAGRYVTVIQTVTAGAHNAYAMVPIAVLGAALAIAAFRRPGPPALIALGALGLVAMLIAVLGDFPDAHAHGLTSHYALASNSPGPGLYLEAMGGILLLLAAGLGLSSGSANGGASTRATAGARRTASQGTHP